MPEDDDPIRVLVTRLARPNRTGGAVIERAAILAEGADANAVLAWITAHDGAPDDVAPKAASSGLHSARMAADGATRTPLRYVFPPGVLS